MRAGEPSILAALLPSHFEFVRGRLHFALDIANKLANEAPLCCSWILLIAHWLCGGGKRIGPQSVPCGA
jgi:hypothetical protein